MINEQKWQLADINRQIALAEERVMEHCRLIQTLKLEGWDTEQEDVLISLMLQTVETMRQHRQVIEIYIAAVEKAANR
jgi:hypothetical protein